MGASRDLTISVFVEATLVLSLAVAALVSGTTDLAGVVAGTSGGDPWATPALALAALAFALVVVAETGRQPVDNPDTHLELTMIHEGPLLEYGGRDLALLQWAAAARHWLVLVLAAQVFLPHAENVWLQLALLPLVLAVLCAALALTETLVAKMRILLAPRLFAVGAAWRCSASSRGWWTSDERVARLGGRGARRARRRRAAPVGRGRDRDGAGTPARRRRARRSREPRTTSGPRSRSFAPSRWRRCSSPLVARTREPRPGPGRRRTARSCRRRSGSRSRSPGSYRRSGSTRPSRSVRCSRSSPSAR